LALAFFDFRAEGISHVPLTGGAILACTHQSHLDPVVVRAPVSRTIGYVARSTLFRNPAFAWIIRRLGAMPFERESAGAGDMKGVVDTLRGGAALVFFPEGTRTKDGSIGKLRAGIALLARMSRVPVIPVAVDGTFSCWPRHRKIFRPGRVRVVYGEPVVYGRGTKRDEVLADLSERLHALRQRAIEMA